MWNECWLPQLYRRVPVVGVLTAESSSSLRFAMKKVILMFLGFALSHIAFADQNDFRCLQSIHLQKPIRLQFNFPQGTQETSSVTYSTSKESIPIKLKS